MRKTLVATAVAAVALASPAAARDGHGYVGFEAGALWAKDMDFDLIDTSEGGQFRLDDFIQTDFKKPGLDLDLIGGYDFGVVRAEAELGYKRARVDEVGGGYTESNTAIDGTGNVNVFSIMGNVLLDFGNEDGLSFYGGGGLGWARVKVNSISAKQFDAGLDLKDSGLAWQLIAGARYAITPQLDLGLKYRYFRSAKVKGNDALFVNSSTYDWNGDRFQSHSLLASLIFNFGDNAAPLPPPPPPPPAPPPPPPPATQTCADGSVILATDSCPLPPPPPPPPEPAPERG